jgi:hypothetical protein
MQRKVVGIGLLVVGAVLVFLLALMFVPVPGQVGWEHPAVAAAQVGDHAQAPALQCWDCHGDHPPQVAPPAGGMLCFDCHTIITPTGP